MQKTKRQIRNCGEFTKRAHVSRPKNIDVRSREYLTVDEVKALREAAKKVGRHTHRDFMLIMVAYRHALRVSELVDLRWDQIDKNKATILINRQKRGKSSMHHIEGDELRGLRELERQYPNSAFVFCSERKGPLSRFTVNDIVERAGKEAGINFKVHPHMLRHSKGYALVNDGEDTRAIQDYFGHRDISATVIYTELDQKRMKGMSGD